MNVLTEGSMLAYGNMSSECQYSECMVIQSYEATSCHILVYYSSSLEDRYMHHYPGSVPEVRGAIFPHETNYMELSLMRRGDRPTEQRQR